MSSMDRFERTLPTLLDELAAPRTPAYFDDIIGQVDRTRQRPGWTFPERWLPMSALTERLATAPRVPLRAAVAVALLVLAVAAGALLIAGSQQRRVPAPFGPAGNGLIPFISGGQLYVGDPATGETRLLAGGGGGAYYPQFSPDGTRVAFLRDAGVPMETGLFVVQDDGSGVKRVWSQLNAGVAAIAWRPDGQRIAIVHQTDGVNQLDLVDASGSGSAQRIAAAAGLDSLQFRPPDGREILFRAAVDDSSVETTIKPKLVGLFVMNADGTNVRTLATATSDQPADTLDFTDAVYSADGSRIFYNHWTEDASFGDAGCCQLFVMHADGSDQHKFVPNTGDTWDGSAMVSPDGTRIAFWHSLPNRSTHGVSVIRADGTGPVVETGPQLPGTADWVWAPDASKILMYPNDDSSQYAYLLDPDGGPWTTVPWRSDPDLDWQRVAP
jgi:dipeptidyl aminopeptidase/acylaminoacyl peptidase